MKTIINGGRDRSICYLITGVIGFIGSHLARALLKERHEVIGIDSITDYYDPQIKLKRLSYLREYSSFYFYQDCVSNHDRLSEIFRIHNPGLVIHLAAQAGVVVDDSFFPSYVKSNVRGTEVIVRLCTCLCVPLIFASSSSVYGDCPNVPFQEGERNLVPMSLYAGTKLHNEQIVSFYTRHLGLKAVGLRFFSVYGEDMRPDMAISKFTSSINNQIPITLYGDEYTSRDFTYIEDLICAVRYIIKGMIVGRNLAPIYNIGNGSPIPIRKVFRLLEEFIGKEAEVRYMPLRSGEAQMTYSDSSLLYHHFGYRPNTEIKDGLQKYIAWYLQNQL